MEKCNFLLTYYLSLSMEQSTFAHLELEMENEYKSS